MQYVYSPVTGRKTDTKVWKLDGGNWIEDTSTDYTYDELGRLATVTANIRNSSDIHEQTSYDYDLVGNRKSTTLPNGVYTWYDYNALNRLTTLKHFSQYEATPANDTYRISSFAYTLNAQGMRTGIAEFVSENRCLAYQYDALNRVIQEDSYNAATMNPVTDDGYTALYEYDLAGNRLGRQVTVVRNSSNPDSNILSTEYTEYDSGDRLRKEHSIEQAIFAAIPQGENDRIYAFADGQGGFGYKLSDSTTTIGQFKAFLLGLPSFWNRLILIALMVLIPVVFLSPMLFQSWSGRKKSGFRIKSGMTPQEDKPTLSLYHRSLCILFAYIFLIGPETIQTLAYNDTQYNQLSTQAWGHAGDYITYYYDANGSLTYKIYADVDTTGNPAAIVSNNSSLKYDKSEYNLQNHLSKLTQYSKSDADAIRLITEYSYNPDGIRTGSKSYKTVNNGTAQEKTTTDYLIDPANHTGYTQVLEERTTAYDASDIPTTQNRIAYTIGDDIISQTKSDWTWNSSSSAWDLTTPHDTEYLLYDGQGSTRQLVRPNKTVIENYNYDSYGIMLGGNPTATAPAATKLLYTGEQFDTAVQSYYLRARYYDPMNGRFTQMDPFGGNTQDPQSLHKYLYCHANPVNGIDPTGMFFALIDLVSSIANSFVQRSGESGRCQPAMSIGRALNKAMNLINKIDEIWNTLTTLREFTRFTDLTDVEQEVFSLGLKGIMNALNTFNINISLPTIKIPMPRSLVQKIRRKVGPLWDTLPMQAFLGTAMAALVMTIMGWETTDVAADYHGVDAIMKIPHLNMFAVVEAKGGSGKLGLPSGQVQMCDDWIKDRVKKAINKNSNSADTALLRNYIGGPLFAAIVKSDLTGNNPEIAVKVQTYPGISKGSWGKPFE